MVDEAQHGLGVRREVKGYENPIEAKTEMECLRRLRG